MLFQLPHDAYNVYRTAYGGGHLLQGTRRRRYSLTIVVQRGSADAWRSVINTQLNGLVHRQTQVILDF